MKDLRGHSKRYFSLAAIAMHSTLHHLSRIEEEAKRHRRPHLYHKYKTSPPKEQ